MASLEFSKSVLKSKFRGCLIGALAGDCLGIPFEFKDYDWDEDDTLKIFPPSKQTLGEFMNNLISEGILFIFYLLIPLLNCIFLFILVIYFLLCII